MAHITIGRSLDTIHGSYETWEYVDGLVYWHHYSAHGDAHSYDEPFEATQEEWETIIEEQKSVFERYRANHPESENRIWIENGD